MKNKNASLSKFVLTDEKLKKFLNKKNYKNFMELKMQNQEMNFGLANCIASAIKKWAISLGATYYTHWFVPLTGKSAEKHVSFLDLDVNGKTINCFNGNALIKGEIDASSFPNGGERMTFEARGYTVWDYTSPVFIKSDCGGNLVLYIPTAFCSYTGVALDEKTPLLRATEQLNINVKKFLNLIGINNFNNVVCNVGSEQEYFLIDKENFEKRKDLVLTGRTLLGSNAIWQQEMYSHYFGKIDDRISCFMHELDKELWKVGIMAKIQHNEVAPSQYEIVPIFKSVNIATDQNILLMDIMNQVAEKHNFKVLFREKPFKNLNGSGKHNNWSIATDTGINLLDANDVDEETFLAVFTTILSAFDKHSDLLKMSTSSYNNDYRLGGNEAPPSTISVFVGEDISEMLKDFIENKKITKKTKTLLELQTKSVYRLYRDTCDRNRTSPLAYTGNKFEFRMVGSSQNIALCNTVIATIVADEFKALNEKLAKSKNVHKDLKNAMIENIKEHSKIIFNGNCYDPEWNKFAKSKGLKTFSNSIESIEVLTDNKNVELFESNKVMSKLELEIRRQEYLKKYYEEVLQESKTLCTMIKKEVLLSLNDYLKYLCEVSSLMKDNNLNNVNHLKVEKIILDTINNLFLLTNKLEDENKLINNEKTNKEKCLFAKNKIVVLMEEIRKIYDDVEPLIVERFKPFPTYDDLLFN